MGEVKPKIQLKRFKTQTIVIGVLVIALLLCGGYVYKDIAKKQKEKQTQEELQKLQGAYLMGIKQLYNLSNNCQVVTLNIATSTRQVIDLECAQKEMQKELKKLRAEMNCPPEIVCEECEICE